MNFIPKIEYIELNTGIPKTVTFDSPPENDPFGEEFRANTTKTKSNNGRVQVQFNYIEQVYNLEFIFQSETVKDAVIDFYRNHAVRGGKFDYYPSSDELDFETFSLESKNIALTRPIPVGSFSGLFEYDFKLKFERIL